MAGCDENGNECSGSIKRGVFLNEPRTVNLSRMTVLNGVSENFEYQLENKKAVSFKH
jgi:hypothetical protein